MKLSILALAAILLAPVSACAAPFTDPIGADLDSMAGIDQPAQANWAVTGLEIFATAGVVVELVELFEHHDNAWANSPVSPAPAVPEVAGRVELAALVFAPLVLRRFRRR